MRRIRGAMGEKMTSLVFPSHIVFGRGSRDITKKRGAAFGNSVLAESNACPGVSVRPHKSQVLRLVKKTNVTTPVPHARTAFQYRVPHLPKLFHQSIVTRSSTTPH